MGLILKHNKHCAVAFRLELQNLLWRRTWWCRVGMEWGLWSMRPRSSRSHVLLGRGTGPGTPFAESLQNAWKWVSVPVVSSPVSASPCTLRERELIPRLCCWRGVCISPSQRDAVAWISSLWQAGLFDELGSFGQMCWLKLCRSEVERTAEKLQGWWFSTLADLRAYVSFIYGHCFYGELSKKASAKWKETEFQFSEYCLRLSRCESKWFKNFHSILTFLTKMCEHFSST